jgi:hypothetical protein
LRFGLIKRAALMMTDRALENLIECHKLCPEAADASGSCPDFPEPGDSQRIVLPKR